ncbi:MAG: MerR family transcriptional regulator, partial [Bacteroidota bacterium]|nr:MerR family transcriptional regulator [Bacteroidota bacterium]
MGQYSIKEIESLSGVKAHTLRIWEQRYGFLKPERTDTNIRFYTDEQLKLILNISTLNRTGMKISKIACLKQDQLLKEVEKLSEHHVEPNAQLDALVHCMIDFDEARFEKTLSCGILKHGFEKAFTGLIFPLMLRTGTLWTTGVIRPAQEHFMTNLVRRKIIAAIDSQYVDKNADSRKFVLFLPEGERHELLLLFTEYLLRKNNHEVAYIGNSLPFNDIDVINNSFKPDYLVTYFTVPLQDITLQDYINRLSNSFPKQKLIFGGKQLLMQRVALPANAQSVCCVEEL